MRTPIPRCGRSLRRVAAAATIVAASAGLVAVGGASAERGETRPPVNTEPPVIAGTAQEGQILSADPGRWKGDKIDFSYQWRVCDAAGGSCADIAKATTRVYPARQSDAGRTLRVVVTATTKKGSTAISTAQTAVIGTAPANTPVASSRPTITGLARQGGSLTAQGGSWAGSPPVAIRYSWWRCDERGGGCRDVDRHGQTYPLGGGDVGRTLRVLVRARNGAGTSAALSDPSSQVAAAPAPSPTQPSTPVGSPPKNTSKPTIAGTARQGQTLTASSGSWTGKQPITFEYRWVRCNKRGGGCDGVGESKQTYTLSAGDVGRTLRVRVRASNSDGKNQAQSDATDPVVASQGPVNTKRPQIEGTARQGETLTASPGTWNGSGQISYTYQWRRCNSTGSGCSTISSGRTYVLGSGDVGRTVRVLVTATNSAGSGQELSDPTAVVAPRGSAPANTRRPTIGGRTVVGQTLTASSGSWNGDKPIQFSYVWQRCDTAGAGCRSISGANAPTYKLTSADAGRTLRVAVIARNSLGAATVLSDPSGVVKGLPVVGTLPGISGSPRLGATLRATLGSWTSPVAVTFFYQWARCDRNGRNCVPIRGAVGQNYIVSSADVGRTLIVQIKAQNAVGASYANSRPTAVIGGSAPSPSPSPPPPTAGRCAPISTVSLPERLVIDRIEYTPNRIRTRRQPLIARFHVTTTRGRCVSGALVYAVGVPFDRLSRAPERVTNSTGWVAIRFRVLPTFPLRPGNLVVIFVRARKPGGGVLAGVSTRRLVSVRVGS